jgi:hypothetical protein
VPGRRLLTALGIWIGIATAVGVATFLTAQAIVPQWATAANLSAIIAAEVYTALVVVLLLVIKQPLGCHRRRVPDRVVFDKLIQVLVFGCGYRRIADHACLATTLRRRRDEWVAAGVAEQLRLAMLAAYHRLFGLELAHRSVDGCITKARWRPDRRAQPGRPPQAGPETLGRRRGGWHPAGRPARPSQPPR